MLKINSKNEKKTLKRNQTSLKEKRKNKTRKKVEKDFMVALEEGRAVQADMSKQKLDCVGSNAKSYYVNREIICIDCGKKETWKANRQKWWYEIAGGDIESKAIRCRACRKSQKRKKEARRQQSEENRKKNLARKRKASGR